MNGDGRSDLAISNSSPPDEGGRVYVLAGVTTLPASAALAEVSLAIFVGEPEEGMADSLGAVGDLDADGLADLAAASARSRTGGPRLWIFPGAASLAGAYAPEDATTRFAGGNVEAEGDAIASALDLNGDGAIDLAFSGWSTSSARAEAWLVYGAR